MKSIFLLTALFVTWLFTSLGAHAEGGCPLSMQPYQPGPNQPWSCMPVPGNSNAGVIEQVPEFRTPAPVWQDRWGAVAGDKQKGIIGFVIDSSSESVAEKTALADCAAKGGVQCKMENTYRNTCMSMTVGNWSYNISSKKNLDEAIAIGMKKCREGDKNCTTFYSACSLPVRIQ